MDYKSICKKIVAGALVTTLAVGGFGAFSAAPAHAETGAVTASVQSQQDLIKLLQELIALLTKQLAAIQGGAVADDSDDDSNDDSDDDAMSCDDDDEDDTGLSEAEATVYTNETLVKIELDGTKSIFDTDAEDRDDIVDEILDRYNGVTRAEVEAELTVETEDRKSRNDDLDWADEDGSCEDDDDGEDDDKGHGNDDDHDDDDNPGQGGGGHGSDDDDDDEDDDD